MTQPLSFLVPLSLFRTQGKPPLSTCQVSYRQTPQSSFSCGKPLFGLSYVYCLPLRYIPFYVLQQKSFYFLYPIVT
ncbi:hypothetical protein SSRV2_ORF52 [Saccharolobus shibatae rod virus 2]|nr:hypothetical protein [Saccharolobus shibatae filamentous virus 3]WHA35227.1 hypothetical protein SSRV2_ORF52 [Saccharolobus shibatae rod virus 2]